MFSSLKQQKTKEDDDLPPPIIQFALEKPYKDPIEARKIAEERKYEKNRINYMKSLENSDKKAFETIIKSQENLTNNLNSLTNTIKTLSKNDKSGIFTRINPTNPSIDTSTMNFKSIGFQKAFEEVSEGENYSDPPLNGGEDGFGEDDMMNVMFKRGLRHLK